MKSIGWTFRWKPRKWYHLCLWRWTPLLHPCQPVIVDAYGAIGRKFSWILSCFFAKAWRFDIYICWLKCLGRLLVHVQLVLDYSEYLFTCWPKIRRQFSHIHDTSYASQQCRRRQSKNSHFPITRQWHYLQYVVESSFQSVIQKSVMYSES